MEGLVKETKLRRIRKAAGLKQVELASRAGVCISSLCYYERGYFLPTLPTAKKIARALACDVSELFDISQLKRP